MSFLNDLQAPVFAALALGTGALIGSLGATQRKIRYQIDRLTAAADRIEKAVDIGNATGIRNETAAGVVADDLAAAHSRADNVPVGSDAGSASDAAQRGHR